MYSPFNMRLNHRIGDNSTVVSAQQIDYSIDILREKDKIFTILKNLIIFKIILNNS